MSDSTFERLAPWSGGVAGLCWIGQSLFQRMSAEDTPGGTRLAVIHDNLALNYASVACLVVMGMAVLVFATAVRTVLRGSEPGEATWSGVAYAGWLLVAAGLSQMVVWSWGLVNGAADAGDGTAVRLLGYVWYFGWAGMGIGLATAFLATGIGGRRGGVLPRWFAVTSIVLGVLGALGDAGIPPGGLVNYVLLPFWLLTASVILARRQRLDRRTGAPVAEGLPA